jgi:hypothetical protein
VRYIRPSVPSTSWWEKEPEVETSKPTAKKIYPETGKYVKITKVSSKETRQKDVDRASWVGKGAELWTAE